MQSPSETSMIDFTTFEHPRASEQDLSVVDAPSVASSDQIIGYVIKAFPRLSETFILNEILAREANGERVEVASLRSPSDIRFHGALGSLQARIEWIPADIRSADRAWLTLGAGQTDLPGLADALPALLSASATDALQAIEVARWAQRNGITHLHAHFATVATTVARLASKLCGVPYSFTAHAKDIFHESVDDKALQQSIRDAHHVVTVSNYNVAYLRERFGDDAAKVRRVYNGVDLSQPARQATPGAGPSGPIVSVGRLVPKKGFEHLVDAAAHLRDRGVSTPILIGGTGRLESHLNQRIADRAVSGQVRMLGALEHAAVKDLIRSGSVFAGPFVTAEDGDREGLPTVLLEAMALGAPIVTTPVTGIPEAVIDGVTGLLVPEGDPEGLAEAITAVLADQDLAQRLAFAARRRVEQLFSLDRQASEMARLCWEKPSVSPRKTQSSKTNRPRQPQTPLKKEPVVAYVCADPGIPVFGTKGASAHVRSILTEFVRKGWQVHLLAANYGGVAPNELRGISCHQLPTASTTASDAQVAEREASLIQIDSLIPEQLTALGSLDLIYERYSLWSCSAMEYASDQQITSVLEINAPLVDEQIRHRSLVDEPGARQRTARAIRSASVAFAVSQEVADWAMLASQPREFSNLPAPGQLQEPGRPTVHVISNGVDPLRFPARRPLNATGGAHERPSQLVAGFLGTFRPWHDVSSLVAAVAKANAHLSDLSIGLLLVGDGPGLAPAVELAEALGIGVEATGAVKADAVPGLLARMDIGLAAYPVGDGYFSPLKVFEYLAAGLPVIASRVGGLDTLFEDGTEILLSEAGDYGLVVQQIMLLSQEPALRDSLGAAGRKAVTLRHSWSQVLDEVMSLLGTGGSAERELVYAGTTP